MTSYRKIAIERGEMVRRTWLTTHFLAFKEFFLKTRFILPKNVFNNHLMQRHVKKVNFENCADVSKNISSPHSSFLPKHFFPESPKYSRKNKGSTITRVHILQILWAFPWTRDFSLKFADWCHEKCWRKQYLGVRVDFFTKINVRVVLHMVWISARLGHFYGF